MAFAVIHTGGKQYRAEEGSVLSIEKIKGDFKVGDKVTFDKVLLTDDGATTTIGTPYLDGKKVTGEITDIGRHEKVVVVKYKAKSRYFKNRGHRQPYFAVKITSIK